MYAEYVIKCKQECLTFCNDNMCQIWQKDLNKNQSKILVAATYKEIYDNILQGKNNYYEYWLPKQPLKFYIDFDCKLSDNQDYLESEEKIYIKDIIKIINHVKTFLGDVKFYIMKSIPVKDKLSYHVIFDNRFFTSHSNMKSFVEDVIKPQFLNLFQKNIFDVSVYGNKCFRTLYSEKHSTGRVLYLVDNEKFFQNYDDDVITTFDFDDFLKTCISYLPPDCKIYNHKSISKPPKVVKPESENLMDDKQVVKHYIDLLSPERYNDRNKWLNVGFILHSINPEYNDIWHYFSKKWDNYQYQEVETAWKSFASSDYIYTMNNLIHLSKKDNPEMFEKCRNDIINYDLQYLRNIDCVLSKFIYRIYQNDFCCADSKTNTWYYYNGRKWIREDNSVVLRQKTIGEVFKLIDDYYRKLCKETEIDEDTEKKYKGILRNIGNGKKLNSLDILFHKSDFQKILDQDDFLIGFENGIYDLKQGTFRESKSDDYISLSTGYCYEENYDERDYKKVMTLIEQILPNKSVRDFTLMSLASCLDGTNRDENFYIWTGKHATGGNGKTTLMNIMSLSLGDYAYTAPATLITLKRESSSGANSSLFAIKNKRFVIMSEPGANDKIQVDVMKALTGGDEISTRELYCSQTNFTPKAKFFLACNKLLQLSGLDGGTSRRLKVTEYTSVFVETPDPESSNQFKLDPKLKDELKNYRLVFFHILLKYYKQYIDHGLEVPDEINQASENYKMSNNIIKQFIDENIKKDKDGIILKSELSELFSKNSILKNHFSTFQNFTEHLANELKTDFKPVKSKKLGLKGFFLCTDFEEFE